MWLRGVHGACYLVVLCPSGLFKCTFRAAPSEFDSQCSRLAKSLRGLAGSMCLLRSGLCSGHKLRSFGRGACSAEHSASVQQTPRRHGCNARILDPRPQSKRSQLNISCCVSTPSCRAPSYQAPSTSFGLEVRVHFASRNFMISLALSFTAPWPKWRQTESLSSVL